MKPGSLELLNRKPPLQNRRFKWWEHVTRHKDTLSYFNKNYVQPEIFPRELGRKIVKAEEIRHASDYDTFYIASKDVTAQQIETAERLLKLAENYLFSDESEKE